MTIAVVSAFLTSHPTVILAVPSAPTASSPILPTLPSMISIYLHKSVQERMPPIQLRVLVSPGWQIPIKLDYNQDQLRMVVRDSVVMSTADASPSHSISQFFGNIQEI